MQEKNSFVLRGNICYSDSDKKLVICPKSYVVCEEEFARASMRSFQRNMKVIL